MKKNSATIHMVNKEEQCSYGICCSIAMRIRRPPQIGVSEYPCTSHISYLISHISYIHTFWECHMPYIPYAHMPI